MDDDGNTSSEWGWDSDGMMWTLEDGEYFIEDITGNIAYWDDSMDCYVLYDAFDGRMYEWDETRHMML